MITFALFLCLVAQSSRPKFVAARDYSQKSVADWVAELGPTRPSLAAIWSIYYADSRTNDTVNALKAALRETETPSALRALDTILNHWRVPCEVPSAHDYSFLGDNFIAADALFPAPSESSTNADELQTEPRATLLHAIDALRTGRDADAALDTLIHLETARWSNQIPDRKASTLIANTSAWAREFAGSEYGEVYGRMLLAQLDRPEFDTANWERLLGEIAALGRARYAAAKALLAVPATQPEASRAAKAALGWMLPDLALQVSDSELHRAIMHPVRVDPDEDDLAAEIVSRELGSASSVDYLRSYHRAILTHPLLESRVEGRLLAIAQRSDDAGLEALRILGHLGVRDAALRRRYIEVVKSWTDFSEQGLEQFPCWREQDEETRAACAAAMEHFIDAGSHAESFSMTWLVEQHLRFSGMTDARTSRVAERFLSDPHIRSNGAWLVSEGFRGVFPLEPDDRAAGRVNQLALRIAGLKDRGEAYASEEHELSRMLLAPYEKGAAGGYDDYVQWGLFHARELMLHSDDIVRAAMNYLRLDFPEGFGVHHDAARAYFDTAQLTLEQEIEMRSILPWAAPGSRRWEGIDIVGPSVSGPLHGALAVELVPQIRLAIYAGNMKALDDLLAITPLVPRDEEYLLATLARGSAKDRQWAIDLIARRKLDTPRLRSAVRDHAHDLDRRVRLDAEKLRADRGWQ
jgi:hypothetical protein